MNQNQTIDNLKSIGYAVAFKGPSHAVLTKPFKDMHIGQVVFKDGTIKTMQSTDAVRAINNEEINMSKYYTEKMINELTEKERTALYNERAGKSVARMRNKAKAVDAILETNPKLALEDSQQHNNAVAMEEQVAVDAVDSAKKPQVDGESGGKFHSVVPVNNSKTHEKKNIAVTLLDLLQKSKTGLTAEQASYLIGGKIITCKLAISHIRTGRVDGTRHTVNLNRKTGIYTYESNEASKN